MDELIWFIIIIAGASVLERFMKAAQRRKQQQEPPGDDEEWEAPGDERAQTQAPTIQDLIAEQLGLNVERRPQAMKPPPELEKPGGSGAATAPPASQERVVVYPKSKPHEPAPAPTRRRSEVSQRPKPARTPQLSLEERLVLERGEPVTLERPRRPEDHHRFHERYDVPKPVASHSDFHDRYMTAKARPARRRAKAKLPDRPEWGAMQRAIIWAEILGPPKGL